MPVVPQAIKARAILRRRLSPVPRDSFLALDKHGEGIESEASAQ